MKSKRSMMAPLLMVIGGLVLILVAIIYMLSSQAPVAESPQAATNMTEPTVQAVKRVSLGDAKAAYDLKTAKFIDTRDPQSYAQGHIPGAINIPESDLANQLGALNKADWYITYCT